MPAPAALSLSFLAHFPDGGSASLELQAGARPLVDPPSRLDLKVAPSLANFRIRLFDDADKIVESDDEVHDSPPGRLEYQVVLLAPLETGRRYVLMLDAQTGEALVDSAGNRHPDLRLEFRTTGERRKAPPRRKKRR